MTVLLVVHAELSSSGRPHERRPVGLLDRLSLERHAEGESPVHGHGPARSGPAAARARVEAARSYSTRRAFRVLGDTAISIMKVRVGTRC